MVFINSEKKILFIHPTKTCGTSVKDTLNKHLNNEITYDYINLIGLALVGTILSHFPYHYLPDDIIKKYPHSIDYYTFITVRNPYDRLYSLHSYITETFKIRTIIWPAMIILPLIFILIVLSIKFSYTRILLIPLIILLIMFMIYIIYIFKTCNYSELYKYSESEFNESVKYISDLMKYHKCLVTPQADYLIGLNVDRILYEDSFKEDFTILLKELDLPDNITNSNFGKAGNIDDIRRQNINGYNYRYIKYYTPESIRIINELYKEDFDTFGFQMIDPNDLNHLL